VHRLALTGTPVENRLGDLASILEFLNPGMVTSAAALASLADPDASSDDLAALGRALKPVLLRRTKDQVLSELPDKTEQVLRCALGRKQRQLYDELRDHYRALLD
jgi:SNF2 family DNA or RNA helicase